MKITITTIITMLGGEWAFLMFTSRCKFLKGLVLANLDNFFPQFPTFKILLEFGFLWLSFFFINLIQCSVFISKIPCSKLYFPVVIIPRAILPYGRPGSVCKRLCVNLPFCTLKHPAWFWHMIWLPNRQVDRKDCSMNNQHQ